MVKRLEWAVGILAIVVVLAFAGLAVYVAWTWDRVYDAPLPEVRISTDPAVLMRGEYLVYGPAHCVACHGASWDALEKLSEGVQVPLSGGLRLAMGPLGAVYSRNLTPDPETGIHEREPGAPPRPSALLLSHPDFCLLPDRLSAACRRNLALNGHRLPVRREGCARRAVYRALHLQGRHRVAVVHTLDAHRHASGLPEVRDGQAEIMPVEMSSRVDDSPGGS